MINQLPPTKEFRVLNQERNKINMQGMTDQMRKEKEAMQRILNDNIKKKLQYEQTLADIQERNEQKMRLQKMKEEDK